MVIICPWKKSWDSNEKRQKSTEQWSYISSRKKNVSSEKLGELKQAAETSLKDESDARKINQIIKDYLDIGDMDDTEDAEGAEDGE